LGISCTDDTSCGNYDEIGHATLIPAGTHKGRVLIWTRCDAQPFRGACGLYSSHVLDPLTMSVVDHPSFSPALPGDPPSTEGDGHFCSGHAWILDASGNPKFLVAGGTNYLNSGRASVEVSWFDPMTNQWSDGPGELPDPNGNTPPRGSWYPTVVTFLDETLAQYRAMALGGTDTQGTGAQYTTWWTMSLNGLSWAINNSGSSYEWHYYPRSHFLTNGTVFTAGYEQFDSDPPENPCHVIDTTVTPQTYAACCDPNDLLPVLRRWHFNNVVLLHTLKPNWTWDSSNPMDQYDLNRVIATMGTPTFLQGTGNIGMPYTLEFTGGAWTSKANAPRGRIFSNAVLLPDRSILIVGGQDEHVTGGSETTTYFKQADRFDPQGPSEQGSWTELASISTPSPPRGYHNVAILLSDGSVLLMGGQRHEPDPDFYPPSNDTVDHFEPPYLFQGGRPVLKNVPDTIHYGQPFSVCVRPLQAQNPIVRFCLIGIGSVTHHFNCCQRYIELMARPGTGSCNQFDVSIELLAPPAEMAPAKHYLLFAVDNRGVPSQGKLVKVTF
jgi:hypothetical protein